MIGLSLWLGIALQASPQAPPLLELPAGWRHERMEFPLDFAPEIVLRGFEDLSFAPGMFQLGSDSYFSYALALRLEGEVEVDEGMLTGFLESYYRGLYHAVAQGKGFKNDETKIHAKVWREAADFRATVATYDPFTNGGALELALELSAHDAPRATEVLGLASPLKSAAPIWKQLHAIGQAWHATRLPPVVLNHVFAVVDRETYDALAQSKFLREEFAVSEQRTTKRSDISYTGLYFYGRRTYFEFLPPEAGAGLVAGNTGLGFGVETSGALEALAASLESHDRPHPIVAVTRELAGEPLPWFRMFGHSLEPSPLTVFALEYEPAFLERWHSDLQPKQAGISRANVLERYAAALGRSEFHTQAPFVDVRHVQLALSDVERENLIFACAVARYEVVPGSDSTNVFGPQFSLELRPAHGPSRVTALELELRASIEHEPLKLGHATMTFSGKTAKLALGN